MQSLIESRVPFLRCACIQVVARLLIKPVTSKGKLEGIWGQNQADRHLCVFRATYAFICLTSEESLQAKPMIYPVLCKNLGSYVRSLLMKMRSVIIFHQQSTMLSGFLLLSPILYWIKKFTSTFIVLRRSLNRQRSTENEVTKMFLCEVLQVT